MIFCPISYYNAIIYSECGSYMMPSISLYVMHTKKWWLYVPILFHRKLPMTMEKVALGKIDHIALKVHIFLLVMEGRPL